MANPIISKVYLLDTPLKNDYKDTFYFANKSSQESYFQGRVKHTFNNVSYLRKEQIIKLNVQYDTICTCNYLMYQNTGYSNKWMYCFITEMKYISDGVTEVHIETDVMQTYLFDYTIHRSFVEREHVSDDAKGKHTIPEGLELGAEYVPNYVSKANVGGSSTADYYIVVASTVVPSDIITSYGGMYNGVYSGVPYYVYDLDRHEDVTNMIQLVVDKFGIEAISCVFLAPKWLCENQGGVVTNSTSSKTTTFYVNDVQGFGSDFYEARNNKLYTYPYCYFLATNGAGNTAIYKPEMFLSKVTEGYEFEVSGALTPGCSIRLEPKNYGISASVGTPITYGLNLAKFPQCNWATDMYTNWLVQNGVNVGTSVVSGAVQIIGGLALASTGAGALAGYSTAVMGVASIANSMNELQKAELIPPQAQGNLNCGDVMYSNHDIDFRIYHMTIKEEYAKIIDDYFDMFGYKVNDVKVPNSNHRSQHWYTKTIDVNITGEIPGNDLQKIKDCYNKGISFWKNPSNIFRYDLANGII